jgi:hypothetical protein
MKRYRFFLLAFLVILLLAACRSEGNQVATPEPLPTATSASERGSEPAEDNDSPTVMQTPVEETAETDDRGGLLYSVPFKVRPDGFSFRNYGAGYPEGQFTIADMRAMFGDGVCSRIDDGGDVCIPTAEAQQWIDDRNADMSVGHCIGFTVSSYRFAQGDLQPDAFSPNADVPFDIEQVVPIMRAIAANGSLYWVESVWSNEVSGTPREVLDALIALGEPVDLSIYLPGLVGGHSLLAYGVEEVAPNQYHILVYDNNFPGQEAYVEVDYEANTWRYDQGALNPDQPAIPYEGDATTETLRFIPLSAYDTAECPVCLPADAEEEPSESFTLLSFLGQGEVLVETALGNIGWVAGEIINEIPGARFIFQRGQLAAYDTPAIILPGTLDFSIEFNGLERVSSMSNGYSVVVDRMTPVADASMLAVSPSTQAVDYQAGGEQSPKLKSSVRKDDTTYSIALLGVEFQDGQSLSLGSTGESGVLEITSPDAQVEDATLLITRLTEEDEAIYATTALDVEEGGGVALDVDAWDGSGGMDVYGDEDGDGEYDEEPTELPNEPLTDVIQQSAPELVADVVNNVSPYIGAAGLDAMLAGLAENDLSGREIGEILRPLHLTDDQLLSLIAAYDLTIPELAELLFALRLEPDRLDDLIDALDLEEEDESSLREYLAELSLFQEIIVEWDFLNTDELGRLAELLNANNLTVEQLGRLLPRMGLSIEELEQLVVMLALSAEDMAELAELLGVRLVDSPELTPGIATTRAATATASPTPTSTATTTATPTVTPTSTIVATPEATTTPDPYAPPLPTTTPGAYPYPDPYPGPAPTATPQFQSLAFCNGDDLRIVAQEPTWRGATVEIWSGETLLVSGTTGPNGEPFEITLTGPGEWSDLYIRSTVEPSTVPLGTVDCPS